MPDAVVINLAEARATRLGRNVCEHCHRSAPEAMRFCSPECVDCEHNAEEVNGHGCDGRCIRGAADVLLAVANYYNVTIEALKGTRRFRSIAFPRAMAMYLCRQRLGTSYPGIGAVFGGRDHSTAITAVRKIAAIVRREDAAVLIALEQIERMIGSEVAHG